MLFVSELHQFCRAHDAGLAVGREMWYKSINTKTLQLYLGGHPLPDSFRQLEYYEDIKALTYEIRLRRIPFFSALILIVQAINLINPVCSDLPNTRLGVMLVSGVCIVYLVLTLAFGKFWRASPARTRLYTTSYWILLIAATTPHIVTDISHYGLPINGMLMCLALVMSPLLGGRESIGSMLLFLGFNLIIAWRQNATVNYCLVLIGLAAVAYLLSAFSQEQYIAVIKTLRIETLHDPLTGLLNRKGGYDKLKTVFELCKRHDRLFVVYMVDIDFFKQYNDAYGHAAGDDALRRIAAAMMEIFCRASDVVCRCGGEEFFIASSVASEETALAMAERLRAAAEQLNIPAKSPSGRITVSIGYTVYQPSDQDGAADEIALISEADSAMYKAKNSGRNQVCLFKK